MNVLPSRCLRIGLVLFTALMVAGPAAAAPLNPPRTDDSREWKTFFTAMLAPSFKPTPQELSEGKALSLNHCAVCHARPDPNVLPKQAWVESFAQLVRLFAPAKILDLQAAKSPTPAPRGGLAQPSKAYQGYRISREEFAKAVAYYVYSAPSESLPITGRPPASKTPAPFKTKTLFSVPAGALQYFPLAAYDAQTKQFVLGRLLGAFNETEGRINLLPQRNANALVVVDRGGRAVKEILLSGTPTGFTREPDGIYVTLMGPNPFPAPTSLGKVVKLSANALDPKNTRESAETTVLDNLRRPVRTTFVDLDSDGKKELLVEEFGFSEGSLAAFKPAAGGKYERVELLSGAGTLGTAIWDFNKDGALDVAALVSQSDESLYLLTNLKKGLTFESRRIFRQQPGWGSNALTMADLNADGAPELIVANGDNMDLPSRPLKNYHGVRVYQNDGRGGFKETYVYPMYGATDVLPKDFDGDGDIDLLALAFYPEMKPGTETAVYLENQGAKGFVSRRLAAEVPAGRWLVSAGADIDGDGDVDVLLTSADLMDPRERATFPKNAGYLLLENTAH